ncbi:MAG: hypothetical protein HOE54_15985, partial [Gammaproteobacteria bacterium]|nr:hypothetical protein [Gammaproteobacteria bacterium]
CTGDIVDGPGCPDTCVQLLKQHGVFTVRGNHDRWVLEDKARHVPDAHTRDELHEDTVNYLSSLPVQIDIESVAGTLLLCHGIADNDLKKVWPGTEQMPIERSRELDELIDEGTHAFLINGHMHFKTIVHFKQMTLINAGTITGHHWPGFTTIDFESSVIQAYRFDEGGVRECKTTALKPDGSQQCFTDTRGFTGDWQPQLLFNRISDSAARR